MANPAQHGKGLSVRAILNRIIVNANTKFAINGDGSGNNRPIQDFTDQQIWNTVFDSTSNRLRC